MAYFTATSHAVFLPDVWAKMALLGREREKIVAGRILRYDADVRQKGDTVYIPQVANLSVASVGADGAYAAQGPTELQYTISITSWKEASVSVPDIVQAQTSYPLLELYTGKIGYALQNNLETDLLGLYSGLSQSVGTAGIAVTDDTLLNAIQILDEGDTPLPNRTLVMRPASKRSLMKIDKFVDASKTGLPKSAAITGLFGEGYGVPWFFSNNVISSSGVRNLLFHKEAFAVAVQRDVKIERFRTKLADDVVGHMLYGYSEIRDTSAMGISACEIKT